MPRKSLPKCHLCQWCWCKRQCMDAHLQLEPTYIMSTLPGNNFVLRDVRISQKTNATTYFYHFIETIVAVPGDSEVSLRVQSESRCLYSPFYRSPLRLAFETPHDSDWITGGYVELESLSVTDPSREGGRLTRRAWLGWFLIV